jgi:cell division protein FtsL
MVSEFINHDQIEIDKNRPEKFIHLTKYEKLMVVSLLFVAVAMAISVCYITYLFSKQF